MWQQEKMGQSVLEMQNADWNFTNEPNKVMEIFLKVGYSLTAAVSNYNDAVGID